MIRRDTNTIIKNSISYNYLEDDKTAINYLALAYCIVGDKKGVGKEYPSISNICSSFDLYDRKQSVKVRKRKTFKEHTLNEPILVLDIGTNEVKEYRNVIEVADLFEDRVQFIKQAIRNKHIYKKKYRIATKSDPDLKLYSRKNRSKKVKLINIKTGEDKIFDSRKEAAEFLSVVPALISNYLRSKSIFRDTWKIQDIN